MMRQTSIYVYVAILRRSFSEFHAERDVTASGRPLANHEGRSERREGKEYSINGCIANTSRGLSRAAPVQLQRSTHRRCSGIDVTHADTAWRGATRRGAAQTAARYVKVGHPARTTLSRRCRHRHCRCCWHRIADTACRVQLSSSFTGMERLSRFSGMSQNNHG